MNYFELYDGKLRNRKTEALSWEESYDIIVVGSGSAGTYSALAAAGEGKRVLLLEKTRWCGGMHIQGLVNGYYYGGRGGLYEETDRRTAALSEDLFYDMTDAKRLVLGEQLEENHITVSTSSIVIGLYADADKIVGIRACLPAGTADIKCSMLIDATSDGHLLRFLPVRTHIGRGTDNGVQPFSSVRCVYLDRTQYDGGLSVTAGNVSGRFRMYHEYRDNGYVNQYDENAFTNAIIRAHASHLKTLAPTARFLYLAPLIGVREGLLFEGEQTLTLQNVLEDKEKPDNVLYCCFSDVDKHGSDLAFDEQTYQNWFVNSNMSTCTVYIPIPVGCVVPRGWKGFLTTGRCLSMDSYVNSAVRMNTDAFRIGQACGLLASMAVDYAQDPMRVPYPALKEKLTAQGILEKEETMKPSFWTPARGRDRRFVTWMTDPEEIRAALSTDQPAVALWSCHLLGKNVIGDQVFEMTKSGDEMLRYNAAIALGLMEDERALPILHEIIRNRRPFYFMDCRRSNQMRSVIAICLCGNMKDKGIAEELIRILRPEEFENPIYHELLEPRYELSIVKEQNSVYYQHFSHAVAALVKIAEAHEDCREPIKAALHAALDDETYIRRITQEPEHNAYYQAAINCKKFFYSRLENKEFTPAGAGKEVHI